MEGLLFLFVEHVRSQTHGDSILPLSLPHKMLPGAIILFLVCSCLDPGPAKVGAIDMAIGVAMAKAHTGERGWPAHHFRSPYAGPGTPLHQFSVSRFGLAGGWGRLGRRQGLRVLPRLSVEQTT